MINSVYAHRFAWIVVWSLLMATDAGIVEATNAGESSPEIPIADESAGDVLAGHSFHGEAFNEGPRQKAYLMEGTGRIQFDVTTKNPEAADFVRQGMGQLWGYWYLEAERSFRQAAGCGDEEGEMGREGEG